MLKKKLAKDLTVSVVIPVYNTADLIKKNLPKVLEAAANKRNKIIEVIVVDDGSSDKSASVVKNDFPQVKLIKHTTNRGFSCAVNTGARASVGNLIVLLNSDVIPSVDFLSNIFENFNNPSVFGVSLREKGYVWARGFFENGFVCHHQGSYSEKTHETFWISGGSGVFRRDYWMKLGGMDEKLLSPFYWEDIDLSYRAAKRGLICLWDSRGLVWHKHESTVGQFNKVMVNRIRERNQLLFIWKNITSDNLFRKHMIGLFARIVKHPGYLRIVFMALSKIKLVIKFRMREKYETKISDEAIFDKFING